MSFLAHKRSIFCKATTIFIIALFAACNSSDQQPAVTRQASATKPALTEPFRYHKLIEVSPENIFDVLSWGRGATETGSFMILESDSAAAKYTTTTGDLDGEITEVYNTDMDMDGNPEILIQAKTKDSTVYNRIYAFEYKNNKAQKLDFPRLTSSQRKGYRGQDNFYIKQGSLMREFPVFNEDSTAAPATEKRVLEYGIRNNSFTVKTIKQEDQQATTTTDSVKNVMAEKSALTSANNSENKGHSRRNHSTKKASSKKSSGHDKKHHRR